MFKKETTSKMGGYLKVYQNFRAFMEDDLDKKVN